MVYMVACVYKGICVLSTNVGVLKYNVLQLNIDYPTTSGRWSMDRCSDKGNVNVCTLYVPHIKGYRKLRLVMSLSYLYTHPYSPHKQYKHYKDDVLVMSCICTCTCTMTNTLICSYEKKKKKRKRKEKKTALLDPTGVPDN